MRCIAVPVFPFHEFHPQFKIFHDIVADDSISGIRLPVRCEKTRHICCRPTFAIGSCWLDILSIGIGIDFSELDSVFPTCCYHSNPPFSEATTNSDYRLSDHNHGFLFAYCNFDNIPEAVSPKGESAKGDGVGTGKRAFKGAHNCLYEYFSSVPAYQTAISRIQ